MMKVESGWWWWWWSSAREPHPRREWKESLSRYSDHHIQTWVLRAQRKNIIREKEKEERRRRERERRERNLKGKGRVFTGCKECVFSVSVSNWAEGGTMIRSSFLFLVTLNTFSRSLLPCFWSFRASNSHSLTYFTLDSPPCKMRREREREGNAKEKRKIEEWTTWDELLDPHHPSSSFFSLFPRSFFFFFSLSFFFWVFLVLKAHYIMIHTSRAHTRHNWQWNIPSSEKCNREGEGEREEGEKLRREREKLTWHFQPLTSA